MQRILNVTSFTMLMVVLLLGVFIPSLPDLDDDDDNVGCAAVMPLTPRQSVSEVASDQRRQHRSKRVQKTASVPPTLEAAVSESDTAVVPQSQVSPPLRP